MRIRVDPGHGGKDPGAVGPNGLKEKDITLSVANKLYNNLKPNHDVTMTRYGDYYISLRDRCKLANDGKDELFISIHCNSAKVDTANGIETFHHPTSREGIKLARCIQDELIYATGLRNRGVKYANFQVLRDTKMPAVLIELGFINNPKEERMLGDKKYQLQCAVAIAEGIARYAEGGC